MHSLSYFCSHPQDAVNAILIRFGGWLPDKLYLKIKFRSAMGYSLNLKHPRTYAEKLQWLKLYDRRPEYTMMVDKITAKEYVASKLGKEYIIPTLGIWEDPDEINFDSLPDRFVLKCNHNSSLGMYICKDKTQMDINRVKDELRKGLNQDYYLTKREWPYKNVKRKIFAEQYLEDDGDALTDYKFFCFNGVPELMYISKDASATPTTDFFDMHWNHLPIRMKDPNALILPAKPTQFEKMKVFAEKLSAGIPHLRVDFYVIKNQIYFGELTFFHNAGFAIINPPEWNYKMGDLIKLPEKFREKKD